MISEIFVWWTTLGSVISIFALLYVYFKIRHRYWADKGVPHLKPSNLLFGNVADVFVYNVPEIEHNSNIYRRLAPHKFGGYYAFNRPILVIRDPELLKTILTKDFAYFYDRNESVFSDRDILGMNLFNLTGDKWKRLRARLTPTFSSGKLKLMFDIMAERARSMLVILERLLAESSDSNNHRGSSGDIEAKDLMSRYTLEVIASCAFGIEANSLEKPDTVIRRIALEAFQSTWKTRVFLAIFYICPKIIKLLGLKIAAPGGHEEFYRNLVTDTISYREKNAVKKNDFIGLLMAMRDQEETESASDHTVDQQEALEMTPELMAAQCFVFMIAGFETSSSAISFCLLELSKDTKIQDKLREEIEDVLKENNGQVTYEALKNMTYMDQVLFETLRMYPSLTVTTRVCTKPYKIPDSDVVIETGTLVDIPIIGVHHDPQYYPNPEEFNPDNFSEENKHTRPSYTFLAFGEGQKICIGMRFGLMQAKLALALLLTRYEFKLSPKMKLPIEFVTGPQAVPTAAHGIWLTCNKRQTD